MYQQFMGKLKFQCFISKVEYMNSKVKEPQRLKTTFKQMSNDNEQIPIKFGVPN